MRSRHVAATILFTLWFWICTSPPAIAQGVGAIGGTVADTSGAVLPGVTVTLASAQGTIGGNQQAISDERGEYQFTRLVPGTYNVKAELQGFRRAQQNVVVNSDVTARLDLKLEVGAVEEAVTVTGQSPLLDTTSALKQTVLSREVLDAMPNRIDVWSVAKVVPSVILSKVDVGGSEAFLQSTPTVHGSSLENGYSIDGMDVSALDGNGTSPPCISIRMPTRRRTSRRVEAARRSDKKAD
jgi:Carboxypeptidase regulatory-like domain